MSYQLYYGILSGICIGIILAWILISTPSSNYCLKEELSKKQTVTMSTFYGTYSCVRRFPK
jgi:LytS/YehU family sensor histidine kinase